jgi:Rrf2 family protein
MRVSAKTEYACVAMMELAARHGTGEPVRIRDIADEHGIPSRFLVQILLQLKGAGLVNSSRGAAGGYQLARPPQEISLGDVMAVVEGPEPVPDVTDKTSPMLRVLHRAWRDIAVVQRDMLAALSIADLLDRAHGEVEAMYYI